MDKNTEAAQAQLDEAQMTYLRLLLDAGCKFLFRTEHFGKPYVWMKDRTGAVFMERIPESREASDA